jgi:hypothetical protein
MMSALGGHVVHRNLYHNKRGFRAASGRQAIGDRISLQPVLESHVKQAPIST